MLRDPKQSLHFATEGMLQQGLTSSHYHGLRFGKREYEEAVEPESGLNDILHILWNLRMRH